VTDGFRTSIYKPPFADFMLKEKELFLDDGHEGDYAPDILSPYNARQFAYTAAPTALVSYLGGKIFGLHAQALERFVAERSRVPIDDELKDAINSFVPDMPFIWKVWLLTSKLMNYPMEPTRVDCISAP